MADGASAGSGAWVGLAALNSQPVTVQDFTDSASFQVVGSPPWGGAVDDHVTLTLAGDALVIEGDSAGHIALIAAVSAQARVAPNRSFQADFLLTATAAGPSGVGLTFTATAPLDDGSIGMMNADAETLHLGTDGGIVVYQRNGRAIASTIGYSGDVAAPKWTDGVPVSILVACDDVGTSAAVTFLIDGVAAARGTLTGLAVGQYVGPGVRHAGINQVAEITRFAIANPAIDVPRTWYVDPSVGGTGSGTARDPWVNFDDAVAEDASDPARGIYRIFMRRGICLSAPDFRSKKLRGLEMRSAAGHGAFVYNAVELASGRGLWTRPNAGTYPEVWAMTLPAGVSGPALIDASDTQPNGRTGSITTDYAHRSRAGYDIAIRTIQANAGYYTQHTTGSYAGQLLYNAGGVNPNTRKYWLARGAGLNVRFEDDQDFNVAKCIVDGMGFGFCRDAGIIVEGGYLEAQNFDIFGIVGNGIQCNQSDFKLFGGRIAGTYLDNLNSQGALAGLTADRKFEGHVSGTRFLGCPVGLFGATVFGDNVSNHWGTRLHLDGCTMQAAAKDGVVGHDAFTVKDCIISDAGQYGVEFATPEQATTSRVIGGRIEGCLSAVAITNHAADATLEVDGTHLRNNVDSNFRTVELGAGAALIRAYHWMKSGNAPTNGDTDTRGGGKIVALAPQNLGDF